LSALRTSDCAIHCQHLARPNLRIQCQSYFSPLSLDMSENAGVAGITNLPPELLLAIFSLLPVTSLISVSRTCRNFYQVVLDDTIWCHLVQKNIPYKIPAQCPSAPSWREAYENLHPCWFLVQQRIWISNHEISGGLVVAQYILSKNQIELWYLLVRTEESSTPTTPWLYNCDIMISDFRPIIKSFKDMYPESVPLLRIPNSNNLIIQDGRIIRICPGDLQFARDLPPEAIDISTVVWPPHTLPAPGRTRNMSINNYYSVGHRPQKLSEISQNVFRLSQVSSWHRLGPDADFSRRHDLMETWGTISRKAYTPTKARPFRGVWVGDYNGHGAEFIAFLQPDPEDVVKLPADAMEEIQRLDALDTPQYSENDLEGLNNERFRGAQFSGPLLGVKITGDVNVPRGEYTFIVNNIGPEGTLRIAEEHPFRGVRVVRGVGHIAGLLLSNGKLFEFISMFYIPNSSPR
jgi:Cyclin D1 binding domain/F-box-like